MSEDLSAAALDRDGFTVVESMLHGDECAAVLPGASGLSTRRVLHYLFAPAVSPAMHALGLNWPS